MKEKRMAKNKALTTLFDSIVTPRNQSRVDYIRKKYELFDMKAYSLIGLSIDVLKSKIKNFESTLTKVSYNYVDNRIEEQCIEGIYRGEYYSIVCCGESPYELEYFLFTNEIKRYAEEEMALKDKFTEYGVYKLVYRGSSVQLEKINLNNAIKPVLNEELLPKLEKEIKSFIDSEKRYSDKGLDFKRGILLYGSPGDGKTSTIKYILSKLNNAISINTDVKDSSHIQFVRNLIELEVYREVLKVIVMEDIDGVSPYDRSSLLNMLDGVVPTYKTIFIATTNYPEKLDIALKNRPSRFDSIYEIGNPDSESRSELIRLYFGDEIKKSDISKAVRETDGFRASYFKELNVLTVVNQCDIFEAIKIIKAKFDTFKKFGKEQNYMG